MEEIKRNRKIIQDAIARDWEGNYFYKVTELSAKYDVSRQRIHQILNNYGYVRKKEKTRKIRKPFSGIEKLFTCNNCGIQFKRVVWPETRNKTQKKFFCVRSCYIEYSREYPARLGGAKKKLRIELQCNYCGRELFRTKNRIKQNLNGNHYCSLSCSSKAVGIARKRKAEERKKVFAEIARRKAIDPNWEPADD